MPPTLDEPKGRFPCLDCSVNTLALKEYYMVHPQLWERVVPNSDEEAFLCVGCMENRIGRKLVSTDFPDVPVNYLPNKSARLLDRLGRWFREFDGPFEDHKKYNDAAEELARRFAGRVARPTRLD